VGVRPPGPTTATVAASGGSSPGLDRRERDVAVAEFVDDAVVDLEVVGPDDDHCVRIDGSTV